MDIFSTPDKIPARPVLKEIHSNERLNNKSSVSKTADSEEFNGIGGEVSKASPSNLNHSPDTTLSNKHLDSINSVCDELINNFHNFGLVTPQRNPNLLSANSAQNENGNSPSSDDEVFQECETTFDPLHGTPNAKIVNESGYRTGNINDNTLETLDAIINFPSNIANSTETENNISDCVGSQSQKMISFGKPLVESTLNSSEQFIESSSIDQYASIKALDNNIHSNDLIDSNEQLAASLNATLNEIVEQEVNKTVDLNPGEPLPGLDNIHSTLQTYDNLIAGNEQIQVNLNDSVYPDESSTNIEIRDEIDQCASVNDVIESITRSVDELNETNEQESGANIEVISPKEPSSLDQTSQINLSNNLESPVSAEQPKETFNVSDSLCQIQDIPDVLKGVDLNGTQTVNTTFDTTSETNTTMNLNETNNVSEKIDATKEKGVDLNGTQILSAISEFPTESNQRINLNETINDIDSFETNQEIAEKPKKSIDLNSAQIIDNKIKIPLESNQSIHLNSSVNVFESLTQTQENIDSENETVDLNDTQSPKSNKRINSNETIHVINNFDAEEPMDVSMAVEISEMETTTQSMHLNRSVNVVESLTQTQEKTDSEKETVDLNDTQISNVITTHSPESNQRINSNETIHVLNNLDAEKPMDISMSAENPPGVEMNQETMLEAIETQPTTPSALLNGTQVFAKEDDQHDISKECSVHPINEIKFETEASVDAQSPIQEFNTTVDLNTDSNEWMSIVEKHVSTEVYTSAANTTQTIGAQPNLNETITVNELLPSKNVTFFTGSSPHFKMEKEISDNLNETVVRQTLSADATDANKDESRRLSIRTDLYGPSPMRDEQQSNQIADNDSMYQFKVPALPTVSNAFGFADFRGTSEQFGVTEDDFQSGGIILNPSDFDFLLSKGDSIANNYARDSILERFDPLSSRKSVIQVQPVATKFSIIKESDCNITTESTQFNESEVTSSHHNSTLNQGNTIDANKTVSIGKLDSRETFTNSCGGESQTSSSSETYVTASLDEPKLKTANVKMSVGLIHDMNNDNMKSLEQVDIKDQPNLKMNDEKKVKHDFVEDIERKLKEAETREESLIRRITEKEKSMNKMSAVMENYEKTIVEMITEREHLTQNYEKQILQLKAERDANFHHLTSLENTFSDLHAKYEKSKQLALEVKENETKLVEKLDFAQQQIKLQEQRYDKLKNHACTQLENANAKLEALSKSHSNEIKKLSAQLKKEEISRQSINEQLAQKTKENEELVKICDELINNGPDGS